MSKYCLQLILGIVAVAFLCLLHIGLTQHLVVASNLDLLLDKINALTRQTPGSKMLDLICFLVLRPH